jgi:5-(carboxyamino)imidazole ribonucleotide synthase
MFATRGLRLANKMEPRVHNVGHWTIEGSLCWQFESHMRAIAYVPLGSAASAGNRFATMINLIGHLPSRESLIAILFVYAHT